MRVVMFLTAVLVESIIMGLAICWGLWILQP